MEQLNYEKNVSKLNRTASFKNKRGLGLISTNIFRIVLHMWTVTVIFPLVWTLYTSFKDNKAFYANVWALPKVFRFENYYNAWVTSNFSRYFFNSLFVVVSTVFLSLLVASMVAYVLAKFKFPGSNFLLVFFLSGTMVPQMVMFIPLYFFSQDLHLTEKLSGLVLIYVFTSLPFTIFLIYGFMKRIPSAFSEAAIIDGCSYYATFFRIILPLAKPGLVIAGILSMLNAWNEYVYAVTFITNPEKYTVPVGISFLAGTMQYRTDFGALFAGLIIGMVPMIIVYTIFQKQLQEGMAVGSGVKG